MLIDVDHKKLRDYAATTTTAAATIAQSITVEDGLLDNIEAVASLIEDLAAADVFTLIDVAEDATGESLMVSPSVFDDGNTYTIDLSALLIWDRNGEQVTLSVCTHGSGNHACEWLDTTDTTGSPAAIYSGVAEAVVDHLNAEIARQHCVWATLIAPRRVWVISVDGKGGSVQKAFNSEEEMRAWFIDQYIADFDRDEGPDDPEALMSWFLDGSGDIAAKWDRFEIPA
ncbi:hypothetical protein [Gordonia alkanivorans]|uniref:hypothetical protein n=1 Tax=Gordonia alkanivorans TaxID=84096 RepID=UPI0004ADAB91|nr:hypothetical protein [Gordonia alkanivorans]